MTAPLTAREVPARCEEAATALERAAAARRTAHSADEYDVGIVGFYGDVAALPGAGRVGVAVGNGALVDIPAQVTGRPGDGQV